MYMPGICPCGYHFSNATHVCIFGPPADDLTNRAVVIVVVCATSLGFLIALVSVLAIGMATAKKRKLAHATDSSVEMGTPAYLADLMTLHAAQGDVIAWELADGVGCLHTAATHGDLPCVRFLVERGRLSQSPLWSIDLRDVNGDTALHHAALSGHAHLVAYLVSEGADPNVANLAKETPLHAACKSRLDQTALVKPLLQSPKIRLEERDQYGRTPLLVAATTGLLEMASALINRGADLNACDADFLTPLTEAVKHGHDRVVQLLLKRDCKTNLIDRSGNQALHWAALVGNAAYVEMLINMLLPGIRENSRQALQFNRQNNHLETPLMLAVREGHTAIVDLFLAKRQLAEIVDAQLSDLLKMATDRSHSEIVTKLKIRPASTHSSVGSSVSSHGSDDPLVESPALSDTSSTSSPLSLQTPPALLPAAKVTPGSPTNSTPTAAATPSSFSSPADDSSQTTPRSSSTPSAGNRASPGWLSVISPLSPFWSSGSGSESPLEGSPSSIVEEKPSALRLHVEGLLRDAAGASQLLVPGETGSTFIHMACITGDLGTLQVIFSTASRDTSIQTFALANLVDAEGDAPLHKAAHLPTQVSTDLVALLLSHGADIARHNARSQTPLHVAASSGSPCLLHLLQEGSRLLEARDEHRNTPLMAACLGGQLEAVKILTRGGADTDACDCERVTPLMAAIRLGFNPIMLYLLNNRPRTDDTDAAGNTVLHWAAATGNLEAVRELTRQWKKVSAKNERNARQETPFFLACREGHEEVVTLLLSPTGSVDVSIKDERGRTCLDVAKSPTIRRLVATAVVSPSSPSSSSSPDTE